MFGVPHAARDPGEGRPQDMEPVQHGLCFKCHPEKRGPWVYEHSAVKVEGCGICHVPHGSPNRFLLTTRDIRRTCIQCHGQHHFNTPQQSCVNCHTQIHGSNFSRRFFQ